MEEVRLIIVVRKGAIVSVVDNTNVKFAIVDYDTIDNEACFVPETISEEPDLIVDDIQAHLKNLPTT